MTALTNTSDGLKVKRRMSGGELQRDKGVNGLWLYIMNTAEIEEAFSLRILNNCGLLFSKY